MARKSIIAREKRKYKTVARLGGKREILRETIKSVTATDEEKWQAQLQLQRMPRNSSYVRLTRRCS